MGWLEDDVELDAGSAALIVAGMRAVAEADGQVHQRELALIQSLESALLPAPSGEAKALDSEELRAVYLRSLIMVGLADGRLSDVELDVIRDLAGSVGISGVDVDSCVVDVKRFFMQSLSSVKVFRDSVLEIARDLELPEGSVPQS